MKILKSGELADILGVTTQTIMNYRKKGMPFCSVTKWGYHSYNLKSILWLFENKIIYPSLLDRKDNQIRRLYFENIRLKEKIKELEKRV